MARIDILFVIKGVNVYTYVYVYISDTLTPSSTLRIRIRYRFQRVPVKLDVSLIAHTRIYFIKGKIEQY